MLVRENSIMLRFKISLLLHETRTLNVTKSRTFYLLTTKMTLQKLDIKNQ
jgi:hypothetical protein